ncbi:hypothetical protein LTR09_005918 [Extremus antarcticus]|uniref:Uncharacterized protein n=1 Tax=Extremus antarcticus TaxID=702011 RepID=A0AAJ0GBZ9_9PEZI|nr:hypothetical protein LTR09_005918 [Extremus antarcticus]
MRTRTLVAQHNADDVQVHFMFILEMSAMSADKHVEFGVEIRVAQRGPAKETKAHSKAIDRARAATDKEHRMSLIEGIRTYPKAIGWSMLISLCIAMKAFDLCLLNTFYGIPQFQKQFGDLQDDGTYQIPAPWQAGLSNSRQAAEFVGLIVNAAWTAIYFTAETRVQLLVAGVLSGIPWGIFQTLCITYASECCPVALRGYLTTWVNFCWGLGQVIGVGSVIGCQHYEGTKAFRVPYALQWMWPLPLAVGIFLAPESPWWLVRKGRVEDAKAALIRLTSLNRDTEFDADETVAMIAHTTALEQQMTSGASYAHHTSQAS